MSYALYWEQLRAFSEGEWDLICRHAQQRFAEALSLGTAMNLEITPAGQIHVNGVGQNAGEPFVLSRQLRPLEPGEEPEDNKKGWCKTFELPYSQTVESILRFAVQVAPGEFFTGRDRTQDEEYQYEQQQATAAAVRAFIENPAAWSEGLAREIAAEVPCDDLVARECVERARQEVVDARFAPCLFADGPLALELWSESEIRDMPFSPPEVITVASPEEAALGIRSYVSKHGIEDFASEAWKQWEPHVYGRLCRGVPSETTRVGCVDEQGFIRVLDREVLGRFADEVNAANPYRPRTLTGNVVQLKCRLLAEGCFRANECADINDVVRHVEEITRAETDCARAGVADAYRHMVDHRLVLEELRRAKTEAANLQVGSRPGSSFQGHETAEYRLDHHFGTLVGRAAGEWEVAFVAAQRALTNPEGLLRLAASAADPESEPEDYGRRVYAEEQARRERSVELLGAFSRWRTAAAAFAADLANETEHLAGSSCPGLAMFLCENQSEIALPAPRPLAESVAVMADISSILEVYGRGTREVGRDYLNMLEIAHDLGLADTTETEVFKRLNLIVRGSDVTAAEQIEEITLELQGAEMLGEATSSGAMEAGPAEWSRFSVPSPGDADHQAAPRSRRR